MAARMIRSAIHQSATAKATVITHQSLPRSHSANGLLCFLLLQPAPAPKLVAKISTFSPKVCKRFFENGPTRTEV